MRAYISHTLMRAYISETLCIHNIQVLFSQCVRSPSGLSASQRPYPSLVSLHANKESLLLGRNHSSRSCVQMSGRMQTAAPDFMCFAARGRAGLANINDSRVVRNSSRSHSTCTPCACVSSDVCARACGLSLGRARSLWVTSVWTGT